MKEMFCFECIEKIECVPSGLQLFDCDCTECGKQCTTIAYPIKKKEPRKPKGVI